MLFFLYTKFMIENYFHITNYTFYTQGMNNGLLHDMGKQRG